MATGCIPLIITDSSIMPVQHIIDWDSMAVSIPTWHAPLSGDICKNILNNSSNELLQNKSELIVENYKKWFSHDTLHRVVLESIK